MISVNFFRGRSPIGWLIRWFTKSKYAHVSIIVDSVEYEARLFPGVRIVKKGKKPLATYNILQLDDCLGLGLLDEKKIKEFLRAQVGKRYDIRAIFSFVFSRDWQDHNAWFCSELVAMALKKGGLHDIPGAVSVITPGGLYRVLKKSHIGF